MIALQWAVIIQCSLGSLLQVAMIGKPRKPTTPGGAAITLVIVGLEILATLTIWAPK